MKYDDIRDDWDASSEAMSEQRNRMLEDLRFSNPADPQQWDPKVRQARENDEGGARPVFCFDQTNQYIAQVVNDSRMNKPQIQTVPASSGADEKVSEALDGMIRQIEYASSASIAYDTAQEHAARVGMGWFRLIPQTVDGSWNEQEIRILRVHDPLSIHFDPNFTMPDGSDQEFGFVESIIPRAVFDRLYPKRSRYKSDWSDAGTLGENVVRVAEYFKVVTSERNRLVIEDPEGESERTLSEDEYWEVTNKTSVKPKLRRQYMEKVRKVMWAKCDGNDFLEEPVEFPSRWIPLIPVLGYETWIEGKRYLCGMVRRMMAGQRAYNLERNTELEWMASQPKAPYLVPWQAVSEHQAEWANANRSNKAYLPFDHLDSDGNPLPPIQRMAPPNPGVAFGQLGQKGLSDLQASIGMYRANLGAPSNETSGIAIRRREEQGDTANFHYIDNLARSMTQAGRVIVDMIPRLYDTKRMVRILGLDGKSSEVTINPDLETPFRMEGKKLAEINIRSGDYDVRCKVGPAYTSLREEAAESLTRIVQSSPQLMSILGPMWARMQDWPEAEHVSKLLLSVAPPPVQALENTDVEIPPQIIGQMEQMKQAIAQRDQQIQAMGQELQKAQTEQEKLRIQADKIEADHQYRLASFEVDKYKADTDRMRAETDQVVALQAAMTPEQVIAIAQQAVAQALAPPELVPPPDPSAMTQPLY